MRATALIKKQNKILLMHRVKNNHEYFVLPGGGVEQNEDIEAATIREIKEETNFDAVLDKKLWEYVDEFDKRTHHFYLVTNFTGTMKLGGPELKRNCEANQYTLEWHDIDVLKDLLIYPEVIKTKIIKKFA